MELTVTGTMNASGQITLSADNVNGRRVTLDMTKCTIPTGTIVGKPLLNITSKNMDMTVIGMKTTRDISVNGISTTAIANASVYIAGGNINFDSCQITNRITQTSLVANTTVYAPGVYIAGGVVSFTKCAITGQVADLKTSAASSFSQSAYVYGIYAINDAKVLCVDGSVTAAGGVVTTTRTGSNGGVNNVTNVYVYAVYANNTVSLEIINTTIKASVGDAVSAGVSSAGGTETARAIAYAVNMIGSVSLVLINSPIQCTAGNQSVSYASVSASVAHGVSLESGYAGQIKASLLKIITSSGTKTNTGSGTGTATSISYGVNAATGNVAAKMELMQCSVKGSSADINQSTGANTMSWDIENCRFNKETIHINGADYGGDDVATEKVRLIGNLFNQTVS